MLGTEMPESIFWHITCSRKERQMKGVLNTAALRGLLKSGRLIPQIGYNSEQIGPASIDLAVGAELFHVERVLQPKAQKNERVQDLLSLMSPTKIPVDSVLLPGESYITRASQSANFSPGMYGYANAKSTTGRHFILVRTLADGCLGFDAVDRQDTGYTGDIWLVIQPLVYPIRLGPAQCLSQLRVFTANTRFTREDLKQHLATKDILSRRDGTSYLQGQLSLETGDGSFLMTIYAPANSFVGYKARKTKQVLDLGASIASVDPRPFFEPIYADSDGCIALKRGHYYLLSTKEVVDVPLWLCAEIRPMDPRLGLFFSHFAGFVDPGFKGTITLEVMPIIDMQFRAGDPVARLLFERIAGTTGSYGTRGNYANQIETGLPKHFDTHPKVKM